METQAREEGAAEVQAASWIGPWDDQRPALEESEALRAVYEGLPEDIVQRCEQARQTMRTIFVSELCQVRAALAPSRKFKAWCEAVGLNYDTANTMLKRAKARDEQAERTRNGSLNHQPPADGEATEADAADAVAEDHPSAALDGAPSKPANNKHLSASLPKPPSAAPTRVVAVPISGAAVDDLMDRLRAVGRAEGLTDEVDVLAYLLGLYDRVKAEQVAA